MASYYFRGRTANKDRVGKKPTLGGNGYDLDSTVIAKVEQFEIVVI